MGPTWLRWGGVCWIQHSNPQQERLGFQDDRYLGPWLRRLLSAWGQKHHLVKQGKPRSHQVGALFFLVFESSLDQPLAQTLTVRVSFGEMLRKQKEASLGKVSFHFLCCEGAGAGLGWAGQVGDPGLLSLVFFIYQLFCLLRVCGRDEGMFWGKPVGDVNLGCFDLEVGQGNQVLSVKTQSHLLYF